ncbi:MAG: metal-sensing transcriptional repressor [Eubacterium sp.]|nr:metal-sensing transcriptional repressor [Eubacterium sp.]
MDKIDRSKELNLLKTARGQIDGIIKMIEDGRYCIDVSKQVLSVQALLKKVNLQVLEQHLHHCVSHAFEQGTEAEKEEKISEILMILDKYYK